MEVSVLQWNIWFKEDPSKIAGFLQNNKADIICLQEMTINSKDHTIKDVPAYIAEELGYKYYQKELPIESTDGEKMMLANGIFSRFPISKVHYAWINEPQNSGGYDDEYRAYVEVTVNIQGKDLSVGTTHMSYTHRFQETDNKQYETIKLCSELKKHTESFVFTGDLNALKDSHTINLIESHLHNAGPPADKNTWTTKPFSYNGFEETDLNWRLDYVFMTPDLKIVSSETLQTNLSDHLPILTKILLP